MADRSAKPPRAPGFDAKSFSGRLHERVRTDADKPYAVFDPVDDAGKPLNFVEHVQWTRLVRDAVNANAIFLDDVKGDLDGHKASDTARHKLLSDRVAALEARQSAPFPGSI